MNFSVGTLIETLNVDLARSLFRSVPLAILEKHVSKYAHETGDIRTYTLVLEILREEDCWEWHYLASFLLCQALCHIPGAYFSAYYHASKAVEMAPNDTSLKEYMLFFNCVPDRPMPDSVAESIANQLILTNPDNKAALDALEACKKRQLRPAAR